MEDETTNYFRPYLLDQNEVLFLQNTGLSKLFTRNVIGMKFVRNNSGVRTFVKC